MTELITIASGLLRAQLRCAIWAAHREETDAADHREHDGTFIRVLREGHREGIWAYAVGDSKLAGSIRLADGDRGGLCADCTPAAGDPVKNLLRSIFAAVEPERS